MTTTAVASASTSVAMMMTTMTTQVSQLTTAMTRFLRAPTTCPLQSPRTPPPGGTLSPPMSNVDAQVIIAQSSPSAEGVAGAGDAARDDNLGDDEDHVCDFFAVELDSEATNGTTMETTIPT